MALARNLSGTASGYWAHLALTEALFGSARDSGERVRMLVNRSEAGADSPGTVPRFRAAAALGLVGLSAESRALVERARQHYPESTSVRTVLIPSSEAAIALGRNAPAEAITALEAAIPSELGTVAGLVPIFLRGEAYLAKREYEAAVREYQKVLDHRGADPFAPVVPLSHLGLARASAAAGDHDRSRREYDALFAMWKDADADLPALLRARAEYARLTATTAAPRGTR